MSTEPQNPSADADAGGGASLKILAGPSLQTGAEIVLVDARITFGSDSAKASVVLAHDIKVSRLHAFIQREGGAFMLYDAESVSGTIVNGEALTRGHTLMPGDKIQMGDTVMTFMLKRAWGTRAKSAKELTLELVAIGIILAVAALGIVFLKGAPIERVDLGGANVDTSQSLVPRDAGGYVDWHSTSYEEGLEPDIEKAQQHYRRGMRCYEDQALDPSNAFSAIMELRRTKAYSIKAATDPRLGFDLAKVDDVIRLCQEFLEKQQRRYVNGYLHASKLGDREQAAFCLRRLSSMFQDRFTDARGKDYVTYQKALSQLGQAGGS